MNAILTYYLGPSNAHGSRITASSDGRRVTVSCPLEKSGEERHREALDAFLAKNPGWPQKGWTAGYYRVGTRQGYAFVYADADAAPVAALRRLVAAIDADKAHGLSDFEALGNRAAVDEARKALALAGGAK